MATMHYKGRFVSCWRQSDDHYRLTISGSDGACRVIELDRGHMLDVMSGNGTSIDFSVTDIAAPADAVAET